MIKPYTALLGLPLGILLLLNLSFFTVNESERAIIARLGKLKESKPNTVQVLEPGLHYKIPFMDTVYILDARLNMTDVPSERIGTLEKETLLVDLFVQWRIEDYALFYNRTYGEASEIEGDRAEQLLKQNVKAILHAEFGQRTLSNVISEERKALMETIRKNANESIQAYGMKIVDVRLKRVDFPPEANEKVYARMNSERKRIAVGYRASGESKATILRSNAEASAKVIIAEAEKEAEKLRGEGDAKAADIYAASFSQSPDFYKFTRSLEAYQNAFKNPDDIWVIKPEGDFFRYFKNSGVKE